MRRVRLYLPQPLQADSEIVVGDERAHYLRTVLRLRPGAALTVFNGGGGEFEAEVLALGRKAVRLYIGPWHEREAESPLKIHLGLAIAKGERMDWAVQKAVELGVAAITPLLTARCNVRLEGDRAEHKRRHWQAVAVAACEQCGRNRMPAMLTPRTLADWLPGRRGLVLDPAGRSLAALPSPKTELSLLIGPEGGLTPEELDHARQAGFVPAALGPRILRVETAAVAALTAVQLRWGDLR
ncbi:16S rRNA (uracil1498-N3)-methyltransferase [Methylomarinovum caldicuralii]|uniref:Ribosomal RNA small subunit methyltransferase E n=1 Tax=Methylomarinovum caldicuralii TaxID=438856 RepID=A0AAU9BPL0_9GAMM|nr:16S rRNA (uracil(1498)-N(3))-methyltransferase [Methylomarinovum caldicuralii]BCX80643.1 16S rRNA (uracil1498-N3)-methyltransferase [Methylomarinovum caldicuralii]